MNTKSIEAYSLADGANSQSTNNVRSGHTERCASCCHTDAAKLLSLCSDSLYNTLRATIEGRTQAVFSFVSGRYESYCRAVTSIVAVADRSCYTTTMSETENSAIDDEKDEKDEMYITYAEHQRQMAQLRQRISALEDQQSSTTSKANGIADPRDQAVLDALAGSEGEIVSVRALKQLYQRETDIRNDNTLQQRVRQLVHRDPFDNAGAGKWRFVGTGGEA